MGKRNQRLPRRRQEANVGCMTGLIRMFYSHHDAKLLLDRKQGSRRHTFGGFAGRRHSRKNSRDFEEIDEDEDIMEECNSGKPTVKKLMEDELGKVKQLKIPNDEVERILADLVHGTSLDKSATQNTKSKEDQNQNTSIKVASPSGSLGASGSECMNKSEENELELALADILGQIRRYHDEWPHKKCKNESELCAELKFLIQLKISELNSPHHSLVYEKTPQSKEKDIADGKHLCTSMEDWPGKFRDALEMLNLDTELFMKIFQKADLNTLENIQGSQNREIMTKLSTKMPESTDSNEGTKSTDQHEATKKYGKESRHIFFWKKEKSNRRHTAEGTNGSQPANKIVILKPNSRRGIEPTVATRLVQVQAPELSGTENSKFSMKGVRRRFRIVTGEARKENPSVPEDSLQKDKQWLKSTTFTIKKDTRQLTYKISEKKALPSVKVDLRPSTSSVQNQRNQEGKIDSNTIKSSKDEFIFYDEAKKHLTELLKDKSQTAEHPILQTSRSLVRMLSLPQRSTPSARSNQCSNSSPSSSPTEKSRIDLSTEETNICTSHKDKKEEFAKEETQLREISNGATETPVKKWQCLKEESQETTRESAELDIVRTEEIRKLGNSETISYTWRTPPEQCRQNPSHDMVDEATRESVIEKPECQEPATPRSSIELISQFSPDGILEKQEQPSPVSVLDPLFHEDEENSDIKDMNKGELHSDMLSLQHNSDWELELEIFWVDKDVRLGYIKAFLELSELLTDQNLEVWYLEDELISPCLSEELHQGKQIENSKLLFDCICEAVAEIQIKYFRSTLCLSSLKHRIRGPPMGRNLISEINNHVERNLHYQFPSTLDQLVGMDLKVGNWMDLGSESEEVIVFLWDFILDELLEEVVYDLWI